jgi:hypothetical protein
MSPMFNALRTVLLRLHLRAPEVSSVRDRADERSSPAQGLDDDRSPIVDAQWSRGRNSDAARHAHTRMVIARSAWLQFTTQADLAATRAGLVASHEHLARVQSHLREVQATLDRRSRGGSLGESGSGSAIP